MKVKFIATGQHEFLRITDLNAPANVTEGRARPGLVADVRSYDQGLSGQVKIEKSRDGRNYDLHAASMTVVVGMPVEVGDEAFGPECGPPPRYDEDEPTGKEPG